MNLDCIVFAEKPKLSPHKDEIRRAIARLVRLGHAARVGSEGARRPSFRLTPGGILELAAAVVEPKGHRPFEEMLFAIAFAAAYGELLATRLRASKSTIEAFPLDADKAMRSAQRALDALTRDLEERIASSRAIEESSHRAAPDGVDITGLFAQHGGYQLERVKPLKDVLGGLPADVLSIELSRGIRLRRELLFTPMAEAIRAQQAVLESIARRLA